MTARPKATHFVVQSQNCSFFHSYRFSLGWCTSPNDRLFSLMQRLEWMSQHPVASLIVDGDEEDVQMKETTVVEQKKIC